MGWPVRHSLSPAIHNAAFRASGLDWVFLSFPVAPGSAAAALAGASALGIEGLSVTMPHKADAASASDHLTPVAERLGAVNTLARRGGQWLGDSTDGAGLLDSLRAGVGFDPAGRRCVVVGAGGAGRAAVLALAEAGAAEVVVVNRSRERGERAAALAGAAGRAGPAEAARAAELVVNATPVGMEAPEAGAAGSGHPPPPRRLALPEAIFRPGQVVVDLVYQPRLTPLMEAARRRGATAMNGVGVLVHQAAHAFRLWTGTEPPLEAMLAAAGDGPGERREP